MSSPYKRPCINEIVISNKTKRVLETISCFITDYSFNTLYTRVVSFFGVHQSRWNSVKDNIFNDRRLSTVSSENRAYNIVM